MNKYPKYIEVQGEKYPINTDFRVALECDSISRDYSIGDYEKILAIIYKLLGDKGLKDRENHEQLFKLCEKYLQCNKKYEDDDDDFEEPSMDFKQDEGYIKASFMSDYHINLDEIKMHWWEFNDLLCGLTEDTVLNRVRFIREESLDDKKDKELTRWKKMKKRVALKHEKTIEEQEMDDLFESQMRGE